MKRAILFSVLLLIWLLCVPLAWAQDGYELDWWTIDSGGGTGGSQTSPYSLNGTVGQADAGHWDGSEISSYTLSGGFWFAGVAADYAIYLPIVIRNT